MGGVGQTELLIIAGLALLLFGPSLLAFWLGYVVGQKKGHEPGESAEASQAAAKAGQDAPGSGEGASAETASDEESGTHDE